jgi:hypothetical protein
MENEMYRQAIIDAKALRASAIANAKASLQEAFEPKIQEMLRMKLSEEFEENLEEVEEGEMPVEENLEGEDYGHSMEEGAPEEGITEGDLDAILAELEAMEEGDYHEEGEEHLNEAKDDEEESEEGDEEEAPEGDDEMEPPTEGGEEDEMEITIKFGELKDLLTPFVSEPEEGGGEEAPEMEELPGDEGGSDDALSLDEILAELEEEDGEKEMKKEGKTISGNGFGKGSKEAAKTGATSWKTVKQLQEANETIKVLSEKLNEINLLNAKLLYMNRIFKSKSLSESQKVRVVKSFDKATSVKEVKSVYEILSESLSVKSKAPLKESRGFASKPTGGLAGTKKPIVDSDPTVDRWQQLVFGNK